VPSWRNERLLCLSPWHLLLRLERRKASTACSRGDPPSHREAEGRAEKLRDERKKVTHELRNQMKRSKRLKDKARQLSNADLLTVMQMREVQEKQKQETAAKQKRAQAGSQAGSSGDTPASSNKKSKAGGSQTFSQ